MTDFPALDQQIPFQVLGTDSMWSWGGIAIGSSLGAPAGAAWPSANLGIFVPLALPCPFVVRAVWWRNGASVAGNIDCGVFGLDGTLIVSCGSTAQAGTTTYQIATVTETLLSRGAYYLALSASSTSANIVRWSYSTGSKLGGVLQAASQLPLANLPTFATTAQDYQPHCGIASITSGF